MAFSWESRITSSLSFMSVINIHKIPILQKVSLQDVKMAMEDHCQKHFIINVNWPSFYPYQPICVFMMAYNDKAFYIHFFSHGHDLRAVNSTNLSPVAQDSCVEFFMQLPNNPEYWNFEFNCIGTVNASHRVERDNPQRLTDAQIRSIRRLSSCGNKPFAEKEGLHSWELTVVIPFTLFGFDADHLPSHIFANLYKCGSKTQHPHFLSWTPIRTKVPNFHSPRFFGRINLL